MKSSKIIRLVLRNIFGTAGATFSIIGVICGGSVLMKDHTEMVSLIFDNLDMSCLSFGCIIMGLICLDLCSMIKKV